MSGAIPERGADPVQNAPRERFVESLGLQRGQRQRVEGFDLVPFFDFVCILLLFGLIGSGLVLAPGFSVDIPESRSDRLSGLNVTAVLTLRPNMVLFNGARQPRSRLEDALRSFVAERQGSGTAAEAPVLLVKLDRNVAMAQFLEIAELARAAGFVRVQIAAEPLRSREGVLGSSLEERVDTW